MKVIEGYKGALNIGDEFKLERLGGYFKYDEAFKKLSLDQVGYTNSEDKSKLNVEILSYEDAPNLKHGDKFIIFMSKDKDGMYTSIGMNNGLFIINSNIVRRYVSAQFLNKVPDFKMSVDQFINLYL
jgi:hypothetical protein